MAAPKFAGLTYETTAHGGDYEALPATVAGLQF